MISSVKQCPLTAHAFTQLLLLSTYLHGTAHINMAVNVAFFPLSKFNTVHVSIFTYQINEEVIFYQINTSIYLAIPLVQKDFHFYSLT